MPVSNPRDWCIFAIYYIAIINGGFDKSLIVPQINHINEFIRPQLVPNSLNKEEFAKYVNFIIFPNFALKP